jgi:hypothetical protein
MCGDSVLTGERVECLTASSKWPAMVVQVRGVPVTCAGILQIPQTAGDEDAGGDWQQLVHQLEDVGASDGDGLGSQWELFPVHG